MTENNATSSDDPILRVTDLTKAFPVYGGKLISRQIAAVSAVERVSFEIPRGQSLGLVGESGCGKSTVARMVMRLLDPTGGTIEFEGRDITKLSGDELKKIRRRMQIVFQDPYASLNPRMTIRTILSQPFRAQGIYDGDATIKRIKELLDQVGISPDYLSRYPSEFSGGQRQRIGIARALCLEPSLLVLDEPVSALDVSIQAQILNLLRTLQSDLGLSYLIIAHDLSVVRHVSERVAVMYMGRIVETADRHALYDSPRHPYSEALLSAVPIPEPEAERQRERIVLSGDPPSPVSPPSGCRFNPRCPIVQDVCRTDEPVLLESPDGAPAHLAACHFR